MYRRFREREREREREGGREGGRERERARAGCTEVPLVGVLEEVLGDDGRDARDEDQDHERRRHRHQRCAHDMHRKKFTYRNIYIIILRVTRTTR